MADTPENTTDTGQVDTPNTTQPAAAEPTTHQHSQRLLNVCRELGIPPEQAATMDDASLRREIQDAELEQRIRASRQPVRPQQTASQQQVQAEPEEEYAIPPELQAKLAEEGVSSVVLDVIRHVGKEAVQGRKTARELQQLRAQQAVQTVDQQIRVALASLPAVGGSKESQFRAIRAELNALAESGEATGQVARDVALAYANVYGGNPPQQQPATPARPAAHVATPTARPTNRLAASLQGKLDNLNGNTAEDFIP